MHWIQVASAKFVNMDSVQSVRFTREGGGLVGHLIYGQGPLAVQEPFAGTLQAWLEGNSIHPTPAVEGPLTG